MWDFFVGFFTWYWKSGSAVWILLVPAIPVISWELIKRFPNNSRSRLGRRGNHVKSRGNHVKSRR